LLHYLDSGKPLAQFQITDFGDRILKNIYFDKDISPAGLFIDRLAYVRDLLMENGIVGGLLLAIGGIYLAANWRNRDCRVLLTATLIFVFILTLMPVKLKPLLFTVTQARYMLVFTPFLAVGAGGFLSELLGLVEDNRLIRGVCWSAIGVCAALNLWLPNYRFAEKGPSLLTAINDCVAKQEQYGFTHLILPWHFWQWPTIGEYDSRRHFILAERADAKTRSDYGEIKAELEKYRDAAVFVPPSMMQDKTIVPLICDPAFRLETIMLPNSAVNTWFSRIGHPRGLVAAAYLFVRTNK
jgi:hypothetical protein